MIMDLLVVMLTGCMTEVTEIEAKRINSLSPFGPAVMDEQGVGLTQLEFDKGLKNGSLSGHVGFEESIQMISDGIGFDVDEIKTQMSSIITSVNRKSLHGFAKSGEVAGVHMTGQGYKEGKPIIQMIHPQQIQPELAGVSTGDFITIKGKPEINMSIQPEVDGGLGTIAMCVNMIPQIINASPGLKTMLDLPVPRAIMGDMRRRIEG
jgi:4-hydroxy-tetrahydrodipicolinate reductase